jgi:asparagine synthase (glutamine-hydrolysing)
MCGIVGVVNLAGSVPAGVARVMSAAITHRGPDSDGFHDSPSAVLGMRRLAIIDVARGAQPVHDETGDIAVVFNGEIYNYPDLQRQLRGRGHSLASDGDTACLPHLYEDHGPALFEHLRGMFAIAVWDEHEQRLLLGRDRLGKKPLYYHRQGNRLWFASELKALLTVADIPRTIDPTAVDQYLTYQYVPHPHSILRDIHKLPPGHRLIFDRNGLSVEPYWTLQYAPAAPAAGADPVDEEALAEELRQHLLEATRIRMVSERPLGAFLSGGLDSSAVVAAMAHLTDQPVATFSIGFAEEAYNELPHARRVAELYGTNHHELVVTPDITDILPRIARMFDEPYADSSAVPSYYLAEMARRHVVVALNGDGGDESLGGYTRYANFLTAGGERRFPAPLARLGGAIGHRLTTRPPRNRHLARFGRVARRMSAAHPADRYAQMMSYFFPWETRQLYQPDFLAAVGPVSPYQRMHDAWDAAGDTDTVNRLLACDVALYLPGDLLPKVDITTMAVSLEARSPLLDHRFVEWAARLPGHLKVRNGTTKYLFKQALEPWLPHDLIHRQKMGFGIPRDEWLQGPLAPMVHDLLLAPDTRIAEYLHADGIRALIDRHSIHGKDGTRVWALLMLELWHREVLEA